MSPAGLERRLARTHVRLPRAHEIDVQVGPLCQAPAKYPRFAVQNAAKIPPLASLPKYAQGSPMAVLLAAPLVVSACFRLPPTAPPTDRPPTDIHTATPSAFPRGHSSAASPSLLSFPYVASHMYRRSARGKGPSQGSACPSPLAVCPLSALTASSRRLLRHSQVHSPSYASPAGSAANSLHHWPLASQLR